MASATFFAATPAAVRAAAPRATPATVLAFLLVGTNRFAVLVTALAALLNRVLLAMRCQRSSEPKVPARRGVQTRAWGHCVKAGWIVLPIWAVENVDQDQEPERASGYAGAW